MIVTHDPSIAALAQRNLIISDGILTEGVGAHA